MTVTQDQPAPYAPSSAILEVIRRYRTSGLSKPFTNDVLSRVGVSDSLIPRTLQALVILDLIDESGNPTDTFEGIRLAPEESYQQCLEEWLKAAYADAFSFVDPSIDDKVKVSDAFRRYQPQSQQGRMVSLFLNLCVEAGITEKAPRQQKPRSSTTQRKHAPAKNRQRQSGQLGNNLGNQIPAALAGILNSLPHEGEGWTKGRRDDFVKMFGTVLDFCIPINDGKSSQESEKPDKEQPQ